jgi:hypothetical protein
VDSRGGMVRRQKIFGWTMSLNENQRRVVAVTLRLLEEELAETERVMAQDERGILYRRVARFTPQQLEQMCALISQMRKEIERAARQFRLPKQERDAAREIAGSLGLAWESLEEIRSHKLKGYGAVDPSLKETLDPIAQRLIKLVFELEDVARGKHIENARVR